VKKLLATLALSALVLVGCDKPNSSKPRTGGTTPVEGTNAMKEGKAEGAEAAKKASEKAKADAEAAKKAATDKGK